MLLSIKQYFHAQVSNSLHSSAVPQLPQLPQVPCAGVLIVIVNLVMC